MCCDPISVLKLGQADNTGDRIHNCWVVKKGNNMRKHHLGCQNQTQQLWFQWDTETMLFQQRTRQEMDMIVMIFLAFFLQLFFDKTLPKPYHLSCVLFK